MASDEHLRELEERYEGYTLYDRDGEKIGKVDDLFVDEADREEYVGVKMGLFGLSGTTLIPMDIVRVDERERALEVSDTKEHVKDAPNFSDDDDITPEYEDRIRRHFGLESLEPSSERGSYGRGAAGATAAGASIEDQDRVGRESYRNREDMGDESVMGAAGAGTATPSGGARDLETGDRSGMGGVGSGDRGGVEGEEYREGYREGFREGYREGLHEGATEAGGLGEAGPSGSMTGAGATEGESRDIDREWASRGREEASRGREEPGSVGTGATGARDRGQERSGGLEGSGARDRGQERSGGLEGSGSEGSGARDRERGGREGDTGERREEGVGTKVWRRIRG